MREPAAGCVVLDVLDAEELVDLLGHATAVIDGLVPDPGAEAFNAGLAAGSRTLADLAIDLALAAADLAEATAEATGDN
jgi:hypothetical protein